MPAHTESSAGIPSRCGECGESLISPIVCTACATLRPPKNEFNHFVRLGLPLQYSVNLKDLERRFLVLARGLHPDQFAQRPPEERALAEQLSAQLNDSYRAIRDPLLRAEYLLELEGGPTRDQEKRTPKAFLMEMLEINEEIEEAESDLNETARESLSKLKVDLSARRDAVVAEVAGSFANLSPADAAKRYTSLLQIREKLNICSYLVGLIEKIDEILLR